MQIFTKDSSITLYDTHFCETYHNVNDGALQESLHKHILPALKLKSHQDKLKILDICFGLGFNAFSVLYYAQIQNPQTQITIHSPEINTKLLLQLSKHPYPNELKCAHSALESLLKNHHYQYKNFEIYLHLGDAREILKNFVESNYQFDIVFQDPFSPNKNRNLWTYEYFKTLYALTKKDALITTYSHNSCMLYSAFLAGFYPFKLKQKRVRDSVLLTKNAHYPMLTLENILSMQPIDMLHKIRVNTHLRGFYDAE